MKANPKRDFCSKILKKIKDRLLHNLGKKILSVFLAGIVWLLIMNVDDPVISDTLYDIPVNVLNENVVTSRGYQYSIESGEKVNIKVKGKRSIVDNLSKADFYASADFNTFNEMYMANINIECTNPSIADSIEATASIESMAIKLEDQVTESFNIKIVKIGEVKEGYYVAKASVPNSLIQITGSVTQISNIKEVVVEVDLSDRRDSFKTETAPIAYDMDGNQIDAMKLGYSQNLVDVEVEICPTKKVPINVVLQGEPDTSYLVENIDYAPDSIIVAAPRKSLDKLKKLDIICDVSRARTNVESKIDLNDYIREKYGEDYIIVDENTDLGILATIFKKDEVEFTVYPQDVEIRNVSENLRGSFANQEPITLKVYGRKTELDTLSAKDLKLYVDMSGYNAGTYTKTLSSDVIPDIDIGAVSVLIHTESITE